VSPGFCAKISHPTWQQTCKTGRQLLEAEYYASHRLVAITAAVLRQWD
jgi:hypothetical protein